LFSHSLASLMHTARSLSYLSLAIILCSNSQQLS
jgi:hypothetical protein